MSVNMTKKYSYILFTAILIFTACEQPTNNQEDPNEDKQQAAEQLLERDGQSIEGQFIVVLKETTSKQLGKAKRAELRTQQIQAVSADYEIREASLKSKYSYSMSGFSAALTDRQLDRLQQDERVDYIEPDKIVMLSPPKASASFWCIYFGIGCEDTGGEAQETPYGINRVGGVANGSGLTAWVIDTGVDLDHDDLNVDTQNSASFVSGESTADDGNGHGTHVAGTIAAIDNDIDVVGVAAGATVVGVKVLNSSGSGTLSGVIAGIDYVAANAAAGDVANMSLGGGASQAIDDAVINAADQGIYFAVAAGNDGDDANNYSPARVSNSNVWTISAIDSNDQFASFSNYGNPPVDYAAPGVDVKSLWKNNGVNTISGTSMASPHAAGVLLLTGGNASANGTAVGDPDGTADPVITQ